MPDVPSHRGVRRVKWNWRGVGRPTHAELAERDARRARSELSTSRPVDRVPLIEWDTGMDITEASPSLVEQLRRLADDYGAAGVADIARQLCVDEGPAARNPMSGVSTEEAVRNVHAATRALRTTATRAPQWAGGSTRSVEECVPLTVDPDVPPPFLSLDLLSNVGRSIDEHLAQLIGRLQPYVTPMPMREGGVGIEHEPRSPLENRITRETDLLVETDQRLIDLLDSLRL
jgi:hypothetical protein